MKLNIENLNDKTFWENSDIKIPKYDIKQIRKNTSEKPTWVHFGAGNIFRGFIARIADTLLNDNIIDTGIIAIDTHAAGRDDDYEMINKVYKPFDNLTLLASIKSSGDIDKKIIGSITDVVHADFINSYEELKKIFISNSLQVASFTITEKGYSIKDLNGDYNITVKEDINNGPLKSKNIMSISAAMLLERYKNGAYPIAMLSIDNCSNNGDKLKSSIIEIAKEWIKKGFADEGFIKYLEDDKKTAFPLSMVDKITPRPSEIISKKLEETGLEEMSVFKVGHNNMAAFVNAEVPEYLVIEDLFPNGRAEFEKAGVYVTDRITVQTSEKMKVTTCLNPLHTALAVFGCLLNYDFIYEEMKDPILKKLVEKIGYDEGMKVVADPKILNPRDFIKEVIEERLVNPYIPDSPKRIATDTSQKIPIRYGETLKSYIKNGLDTSSLIAIPLTIAAWLRYLMGIDDNGKTMEISPDPMLEELQKHIKNIQFKNKESIGNNLKPILSNKVIFAVDLYDKEINLGEKIERYFSEMICSENAVKECLNKYIN
ncbi:mannitol dehydrogenase family protein [Brachyspira hyodysenteriae]|uniref:mannitol dehydrogenase family protein n=1 Tax=Brachyspira hyodysenteriae TaxID=159 RepID=UPI0022CD20AF|nr:mannitol dehydrogenase family protein [Brachyspira hyodysenteriae]MCZ9838097.1 mannitol dehydrogenase family protein [Brachyspira hyodysenteriae]MCZ9849218.1 mannitol dehydrogenase family protein [Brachyspira hyodysenteriae]MCZ9849783.1 mannitol dehydrogenase family protein [Brachyspira hyodysenteriae]MCZ9861394.1 mannitol dehydrogenase family protein [Brachyspira hyodysenteriae]MCZ9871173.1 mannitol dehydrogenase family protein [Brachyspira hyodysenteriae]